MEFSKEELEIEELNLENSDIRLSSSSVKCDICKTGNVVKVGRETSIVIYTRYGTRRGVHVEMRCNNRTLPCRAGHYHGYVKVGTAKHIEDDALRNTYLVTSSQTAFAIDYLWDMTLQILFSRATFEGLGNIFNNLHFTNVPYDTLLKRENIFAKRITEAFFMYAFIEVGQRFNVEITIPKTLDEAILANKTELHEAFRTNWTRKHLCDTPGCGKILVMDGGMKPHRKLCAAKLAGVREFESTGLKVVTGCTRIPGPESKFCNEHQSSESPALLSSQVSKTTRMSSREHRNKTAASSEASQDNIYVIETILDSKTESDVQLFHIKWLNFPHSQSTWEHEESVPKFIQLFYADRNNLGKPLPNPKLKRSKKAGSETYHYLSWDGDDSDGQWYHEDFFTLLGEDGEISSALETVESCNTRKSRDKESKQTFNFFFNFYLLAE